MKLHKIFIGLLSSTMVSVLAVTASAQGQDLVESTEIEVGVPAEGILTETTDVMEGVGIFDNQVTYVYALRDNPEARASKVQFDPNTGEYLIQSNGNDVWDNEDETVYLWTSRPRSYRMTARVQYIQPGGVEWAKSGIMIRNEPEFEGSASAFFEYRGNEDLTERGVRFSRSQATSTRSINQDAHEKTIFLGADSLEPIWLRVTRIWPANQLIYEDANIPLDDPDAPPAEEDWEHVNDQFAAGFWMPEEINWGLFAFDHDGNVDATPPDEVLIKNVTLEPVTVGSRFFSESHFTPGKALDVSITLNNEGDATTADVTETIPDGWTASNISDGGSVSGNTITWSISNFQGVQDLTYSVTPSAGATRGDFEGSVNGIMTGGNPVAGLAPDNDGAVGDFDGASAIGGGSGSASFADGTYTVSGAGTLADDEDSLYFVWTAVNGNFTVEVDESNVPTPGPDNDTKVGVMVRDSLASTSPFITFSQRTDFSMRNDARDLAGNNVYNIRAGVAFDGGFNTDNIGGDRNDFGGMRVTRDGDRFQFEFKDINNPDIWSVANISTMAFTDPVYVGLAVSSNDASTAAEGTFTNVTISSEGSVDTAVQEWSLY